MASMTTALRPLMARRTVLGSGAVARVGMGAGRMQMRAVGATPATRAAAADGSVLADSTGGYKYVPGGPVLPGTVNDATPFPASEKSHGSYHWVFERTLSAALIPALIVPALTGGAAYPIADGILCTALVVHSHLGFDQCLIDYVHPRKFPVLGPIGKWALRAATALSVYGVYEFETNDIGLTELMKRIWRA